MPSPIHVVLGRYDSLDALFCALDARNVPVLAGRGYVRVHPALLPEVALADRIAARERLAAFGLNLVVTSAAEPGQVELRRYATGRDTPAAEREAP